jgi:protein-L-isoaspartate(D-aspartate) O-methyltransferase
MTLTDRRRFYAEEIAAISNVTNAAIVEALASVPREQFLPPGPWMIRSEADFQSPSRRTPDADPGHVYHNLAIAIDPARQLFNGAPGLLAMAIDRLCPKPGDRVLHVGAGTGYYTAVIAHCVGREGRVVAVETDPELATTARNNLRSRPWVDVQWGDGTALSGSFDGVLINAGVTHPLEVWLEAVAPAGRMVLPLTVTMTPTIGKGLLVALARQAGGRDFDAGVVTFVAIYSAVGLRDARLEAQLAQSMKANPLPALKRLRCQPHQPAPTCWLHGSGWCLSTG